MDDLFASFIAALNLPTSVVLGLCLALAVASLFAGRWPAWAGVLLSALRAGAWEALRKRKPELHVAKAAQRAGDLAPATNDGADLPSVVLVGPVTADPVGPAPFPNDYVDMPTVSLSGPVRANPEPPAGAPNDSMDTP